MVATNSPEILLPQETLREGEHVENILKGLLKDWIFISLDVKGIFGGLAVGWNPIVIKIIDSWRCEYVMEIEVMVEDHWGRSQLYYRSI